MGIFVHRSLVHKMLLGTINYINEKISMDYVIKFENRITNKSCKKDLIIYLHMLVCLNAEIDFTKFYKHTHIYVGVCTRSFIRKAIELE